MDMPKLITFLSLSFEQQIQIASIIPDRRAVWKNELRLVIHMLSWAHCRGLPIIDDVRRGNRLYNILKKWFLEHSKLLPPPDSHSDLREHILWKRLRKWARLALASGVEKDVPASMDFLEQYDDYVEIDRDAFERYPRKLLPYVMEYE